MKIVENGTKVRFENGRIGIVDGNDCEVCDSIEEVNYFVCPIELTNEELWSEYYIFLLREEFEIVE